MSFNIIIVYCYCLFVCSFVVVCVYLSDKERRKRVIICRRRIRFVREVPIGKLPWLPSSGCGRYCFVHYRRAERKAKNEEIRKKYGKGNMQGNAHLVIY